MSDESNQNYDHKMAALIPPARVLGTYYQGGTVFAISFKFKEKEVTLLDTKTNTSLELDKQGLGVLEPGAEYVISTKTDNSRRKSKTFEYMTLSKQRNTFKKGSIVASRNSVQPAPTESFNQAEKRKSILPEFTSIFTDHDPIQANNSPVDAEDIIWRLKVPPFKGYLEVQNIKETVFSRRLVELVSFNVIVTTGEEETDKIVYTLNKNAMALVSEKTPDDYSFDLFAGNEMVAFKCISKAQMMAWVSSINTSCMNLLLLEIMPSFDLREFKNTLDKSFRFYAQKVNNNIEEELDVINKHLEKYHRSNQAVATAPKYDAQTAVHFFTVLTAKRSIKRTNDEIKVRKKSLLKQKPKSIEFFEDDEDILSKLQALLKSQENVNFPNEASKEKIANMLESVEQLAKGSAFSISSFNPDENFLEELYKVVEQSDFLPEIKKNEIKLQAKEMSSFLSKNQSDLFSNSKIFHTESSREELSVIIGEEISKIPDLRAPIKQDEQNLGMLRQDSWDELGNPQVYYNSGSDNQTSKFDIGAASIDKLIERLADHFGPADESFLKTIFMCHRHIIDSQAFFKKILSRMNSEVNQKDDKFSRLHLHTRMIKAVSFWIEHYWVDFQNPEMQLLLQGFLAIVEDNVNLTNNDKFKTLSEYFSGLIRFKIQESTQSSQNPEKNRIPKILVENFLLAYSAQTISRSLTELEFERLLKLEPLETLLQLWNSNEENSDSFPNLLASINSFNNVFQINLDHKLGVFRNIVGTIRYIKNQKNRVIH